MAYSKGKLENNGHNNNKKRSVWPEEEVTRAGVVVPSSEVSNVTRSQQYAVFQKIPS
jgi:hypothetical protein